MRRDAADLGAERLQGASPQPISCEAPSVQRFAVRSLALAENFLGGRDTGRAGDDTTTPAEYGSILARGGRIRDSANLQLAQLTMQGLIDPDTQRGQKGAWLLRPFHESLLWYDARRPGPNSLEYSVRKVYMRGSGITLARLLTSPPDPRDAELGESAVAAIQEALTLGQPACRHQHAGSSRPSRRARSTTGRPIWNKTRKTRGRRAQIPGSPI